MRKAISNKSMWRVLSLMLVLLLSVSMFGAGVSAEMASPFKGTSVTLGSALIVNFTAEVTDTENAVMTFQVDDTTQTVPMSKAQHVEGNLYTFPCVIAPAQMANTIEATLSDSGNTETLNTSVRDYAVRLLANKQWDKLAANDMMVATLNYGAATQNYFEYNTENPANAGYVKAATAQIPNENAAAQVSGSVDGITFYGASLLLESRIVLRFYFDVSGNIGDYTFSTGKNPVYKDGHYYVEVPNINPQDYNTDITVTVTDKQGSQMSVTYSPMDYIIRMYNRTTNANMKAMLQELYQYHLTAVNYLADPYGNDKDNLVAVQ